MIVKDLSKSFCPCPKGGRSVDKKENKCVSIKKKSNSLARKERKRFSILQKEKKCYICGTTRNLTKHEAFGGKNRQKSIEWGMVYHLCGKCHRTAEDNENMKKKLKLIAQGIFMKEYGEKVFLKEFGKKEI